MKISLSMVHKLYGMLCCVSAYVAGNGSQVRVLGSPTARRGIQPSDMGRYLCTVSDPTTGRDAEQNITVNVNGKAGLTRTPFTSHI